MTREELTACTRRDLAARARKHRVAGWHAMRKCELVEALLPLLRSARRRNGRRAAADKSAPDGKTRSAVGRTARPNLEPLPADSDAKPARKNRIDANAIDANWIHVRWTLTHQSLARVRAALGPRWHQAVPVLRVLDVTISDHVATTETWVCDVEIVGDAEHWYVPVTGSPRTFRLDLGYRTRSGEFFAVVRSRPLTTPSAESAISGHNRDSGRHNGVGRRRSAPLSVPSQRRRGETGEFPFEVQAELLVHGVTHPCADLSLMGETVFVEADGTFLVRYRLPNGRQVIPAVAVTPDGAEQRTIVLAIERNTKVLEPRLLDESPL